MPSIEVTEAENTEADTLNSSADSKGIGSIVAEMVVEAQKRKAASRAQSREMLNKSDTKSEDSLSKNNFHILKNIEPDDTTEVCDEAETNDREIAEQTNQEQSTEAKAEINENDIEETQTSENLDVKVTEMNKSSP